MKSLDDKLTEYGKEVKKLFALQHKVAEEHEPKDEEDLAWQIKKLEELEDEMYGLDQG